MELFKDSMLCNTFYSVNRYGFLAFLMPGPAPSTPAQVKDAFDVYDIQDLYAKCIGLSQIKPAIKSSLSTEPVAFELLAVSANAAAMKKGQFDYAIPAAANSLVPGNMRKASLPDKMFLCSGTSPFARLSEKTGMAGAGMMRDSQWMFDINGTACNIYGGNSHPESQANYATEYEWDTPRNFGGVIRAGTNGVLAANGYTVAVDAWNGSGWDQVVAPVAKAGAVSTANYIAFAAPVMTTRLRIRTTFTGTWAIPAAYLPHAILPLELIADAPAQVAVPDIGWAVLIPMLGNAQIYNNIAANHATMSDVTGPLPFYVAKVGEAAGPGIDLVLTKATGLTSDSLPTMAAQAKYLSSNIKE